MNYDVEHLLTVKQRLNAATDILNQKIEEFEAELRQLSVGVPVSVKIPDSTVFLKYGKWQKNWRVLVSYQDDSEEEVTVPLREATRTVRLYGYRHRMLLLPAIEKAAESLTRRMEEVE